MIYILLIRISGDGISLKLYCLIIASIAMQIHAFADLNIID